MYPGQWKPQGDDCCHEHSDASCEYARTLLADGSTKVLGGSILGLCVEDHFWILDHNHQGASAL